MKLPIGSAVAKKFFRVIPVLVFFAVLTLVNSCGQTKEHAHGPTEASNAKIQNKPEPVTQIDDAKLKELLKPNGKPLLVNFWATWCGPCREEFPDLVKVDNEYRDRIDFITISLDFPEELNTGVPKFLGEMNAAMPTYLLVSSDENAVISSIAKDWSGALPSTILYHENGEMRYIRQGKVDPGTLKSEIEKTLTEK